MTITALNKEQRRTLSTRYVGLALFLFALLLRTTYAIRLHHIPLYGDMVHYDHSAVTLLTKHIFSYWGTESTAQVTPGYPLFLAACYATASIFTHSHEGAMRIAVLAQAVLSAWSVLLVYQISRNFLRPRYALFAGLLLALYPPAEWSVGLILTEPLFVFLFLLYVVLFFRARKTNYIADWLSCGLALGLATLVRPSVFPLIIVPVLLLRYRQTRTARRSFRISLFAIYALGFAVPMLPWWIRNAVTLHRFLLTSDDLGNPLLYGSDPNFSHDPTLSQGLSAKQQETLAIARIETGFAHHPLANLEWYSIEKLKYLFGTPWYLGHTGTASMLTSIFSLWLHLHIVWVLLGAVGLAAGIFHRDVRYITALTVFCILVQLPFIPINRYVFPIMPLLFIGVAFLVAKISKAQLVTKFETEV